MKTSIKFLLITGLLFSTLSSCRRELLNPIPQTSVSDATAFDQPYRIANQVLSLYSSLKNGQNYGGRIIVYGDVRGEDFLLEDPNLVTGADIWALNPSNTSSSVVNFWAANYSTINQANLFIEGMQAKGLSVVGSTLGNNYLGEARLIRAICYFNLLQFFAKPYATDQGASLGVPLRLSGIKNSGSSDLARSKVADVYTQILADLDFAEVNLPLSYNSTASNYNNVTRAHRNTAIALKTRVYLAMQKYTNVITEANKIVPASAPFVATSGVAHALSSDYTSNFKAPYTTAETILSMPFTNGSGDAPGTQNGLQGYFYAAASGSGSIFSLNPNGIAGNANWKATDKRRSFIFTATNGKLYLTKYPNASPADYVPIIRWAEVLLNLSEALARTNAGVDARALNLVNAVRQRSDATTTIVATTQQELIDAILLERRIEFLGEGLRNNDLMRLLQTIPAKGSAPSRGPNDDGYIWPASSTEKSLNKLWVD